MAKEIHYVGQVIVEAVTVETPDSARSSYHDQTPAPRRTKHTVATVRISAQHLDDLTERITSHLALVQDGGDVDG